MKRLKRMLSMLLVFCMIFTCMPVTVKAANDKGGIYEGEITELDIINFYNATGVSTNGNFKVRGVAVDKDGIAWCILASTQVNGDKHGFMKVSIGEHQTVENPRYKKVVTPGELTLKFPDGMTEKVEAMSEDFDKGTELYIIQIGTVADITSSFKLFIDSSDSGWDIVIEDPPVEVKIGYDITKLVNGKESEELELKEDVASRTLTYTINVKNTGDHPVYFVNVFDIVPEHLSIQSVTAKILAPTEGTVVSINPIYDLETRKLTLDMDITLPVGFEKVYTLTAVIDEEYKGGTIPNTATIESATLLPDEAHADTVVNSYFYVHHIHNDGAVGHENGVEERVDKISFNDTLRNGAMFNVTVGGGGVDAKSYTKSKTEDADWSGSTADYAGLLNNTLYGGIFEEDRITLHSQFRVPAEGENNPDYKTGENGIGFTPKVNEHYYVWEPIDMYLRPLNLAVWHVHEGGWNPTTDDTKYHTVAGYPLSIVDRRYYQQFGFVKNDVCTPELIYNSVQATKNFDHDSTNTLTALRLGLTGYLGCYKFSDEIFRNGYKEIFLPYWVTQDGVKVTGKKKRTAAYIGIGSEEKFKIFDVTDEDGSYTVENYTAPGNQTLMVNAMFRDNNLTHPMIPEMVSVAFEGITAGKSGNIKSVKLTLDLSEFKYDRVWFDVNGEIIEAQEMDGMLSATISKKDTELTIVPHWSYGDKEFTGAAKLLSVTKKNVEDITPVNPASANRRVAASSRTYMSFGEDSSGMILQ